MQQFTQEYHLSCEILLFRFSLHAYKKYQTPLSIFQREMMFKFLVFCFLKGREWSCLLPALGGDTPRCDFFHSIHGCGYYAAPDTRRQLFRSDNHICSVVLQGFCAQHGKGTFQRSVRLGSAYRIATSHGNSSRGSVQYLRYKQTGACARTNVREFHIHCFHRDI